ncbi:MFS transporter [Brasilonema sp. UFV-L1]|uniref:MFS transporter n=1 Tax=Brasilonema sp. UFV-L1 TaxID=2234130 RepID=UPI00145D2EDD|nr:MFS transporter [Brasilonema sp. UFV-L1]NMG06367.1 arabinose transporter permease [Brasilonema sp. UFV-L1]
MSSSYISSTGKSKTKIYQDKNFYIINFITLIAILGGTIINPALPTIAKFFNVSSEQVSWASTLFQLPGAIVTPIFGVLADTFGRKQVLVPSLLVFAIAGALSGFAQNFSSFLGLRLLQGVGTASLESMQMTLIGDLYSGKKLTSVMGANASLIGMSSALFPLLGGVIGALSWRYPLLLSLLAIPLALLVLVVLKLPKQQKSAENFQLKPYLKNTWSSINNRQVLGLMFAVMSHFILQVGACLTYVPIFAQKFLGASEQFNGVLLASIAVSVALVASQLGFFARHFSEIKLIKISFLVGAVALFLIPTVHNVWLLFIPMLLLGAALGLAFPSIQALLAGLAAQESRAGFMSVNSTVQSIGQTLGPFLAGFIDGNWGTPSVFYINAIFSVLSLVVFHTLLRTEKRTLSTDMPLIEDEPETLHDYVESPTIAQQAVPQLLHIQTHQIIELPENFSVIHIGKPNKRIPPDVNLLTLPNSEYVSRVHAQIRFDGMDYYIQDLGSSNGTYINKFPMLPGIWYKLKPGLHLSFGKRDLVSFIFQLA